MSGEIENDILAAKRGEERRHIKSREKVRSQQGISGNTTRVMTHIQDRDITSHTSTLLTEDGPQLNALWAVSLK